MADSNIVDIKLRDTILKLSDDLKEIVTEIETSPKVHQDNYDKYLVLLSKVTCPNMREIMRVALFIAGANRDGVNAAMRLL